jgi:hypothetical protein
MSCQGHLGLWDYYAHPDRYQTCLQVVKVYYRGWDKVSFSRLLHISRHTVDAWIRRFEAESRRASPAKQAPPGSHRCVRQPRDRPSGEDLVERRLQVVVLHRFGQHARGANLVGAHEGSCIGGPAHHEDR